MTDHKGGHGSHSPHEAPIIPLWPWCVAKIERYFHDRRAQRQKENPQDRFGRRTANATLWIAILTFVVVGVGGLQYCTFQGQLTVMQGQLKAMENDQRPWVYLTRPQIEEPGLQVIPTGIGLGITFWMKNIGRTPAKYAVIVGDMNVVGPTEYGRPAFKSCEARRKVPPKTIIDGKALFPSEENFQRYHFFIGADQVDRLRNDKTNTIVIVGCIDYLFPNGPEHHQTRFFYELDKAGPNQTFMAIDPDAPPIGAAAIAMAVNPRIAGDAD